MDDTRFRRVCLETSLKPFRQLDAAFVESVCHTLWDNWRRLIARADEVAVLLWVGDGSEILQWQGNWDACVPWADRIGFCNYDTPGAFPPDNRHYRINRAVPYMANPPRPTFRDLERIIEALRRTARGRLGREIRIGAALDPGPEFVENAWKFQRHPEVLTPDGPARMPCMMHFLTHQSTVRPDGEAYAGFPDGLDAPARFGTFLGRQFAAVMRDLGYDWIWFSNGFGYTHFPWTCCGELFDGQQFLPDRAEPELRRTRRFWEDFRRECPDVEVQVRGTNFTVGMDIAANGVSHEDVASTGRVVAPPPNPPWGSRALGLEMASFLSRMSSSPADRLLFRFYLNDPWFVTNPWYDYYNREPFDIYVPMSAARLGEDGSVETPHDLALLTVDTEKGELLRDEAGEVTPHLLRAAQTRPDAAGPVVWVYPFDDYHRILRNTPDGIADVFAHEWFACAMVNAGLPLNTVCPGDRFARLADVGALPDAIFVAPVPAPSSSYSQALLEHVRTGGKALLYGPLAPADPEWLDALGIELADPLEGDFEVDVRLATDRFRQEACAPSGGDSLDASIGMASDDAPAAAAKQRLLHHRGLVSGGGIRAVAHEGTCEVRVALSQKGRERAYAVTRGGAALGGGRVAWIRGTSCFDPAAKPIEPRFDPPWRVVRPDDWARRLLADLGLDILQERLDESVQPANVFIKRHRGAWYFVGHKANTSARLWIRTEDGAPCFGECETPIAGGYAGECFGKSFHNEVRAFVTMRDGIVRTKTLPTPIGRRAHFSLANLVDADVAIYPEPEALADGDLDLQPVIAGDAPVPHDVDAERGRAVVRRFTGTLYVLW